MKDWPARLGIAIRVFLLYAVLFFMAPLPVLYSSYKSAETFWYTMKFLENHSSAPLVSVRNAHVDGLSTVTVNRTSGAFLQNNYVCNIEYVYSLNGEERVGKSVALDDATFGSSERAVEFCQYTADHAKEVYYLAEQPDVITLTLPDSLPYLDVAKWIPISIFTLLVWWFFSGWAARYFVLNDDGDNIY